MIRFQSTQLIAVMRESGKRGSLSLMPETTTTLDGTPISHLGKIPGSFTKNDTVSQDGVRYFGIPKEGKLMRYLMTWGIETTLKTLRINLTFEIEYPSAELLREYGNMKLMGDCESIEEEK